MKQYIDPEMELIAFSAMDVIATSNEEVTPPDGGGDNTTWG